MRVLHQVTDQFPLFEIYGTLVPFPLCSKGEDMHQLLALRYGTRPGRASKGTVTVQFQLTVEVALSHSQDKERKVETEERKD